MKAVVSGVSSDAMARERGGGGGGGGGQCSAKTHPWVSITHSHHSGAE